jgi:hypothetical protein
MHGRLNHPSELAGFTIAQLSEEQYSALLQLVESYFVHGYEYFSPLALRGEDQQWLDARFRSG